MTSKVLAEILINHCNGAREGDLVRLSRDLDTTLFVTVGSESLSIPRVTGIELLHEVLIATTYKGERYVFAYEDVRGVRMGKSEHSPAPAGY